MAVVLVSGVSKVFLISYRKQQKCVLSLSLSLCGGIDGRATVIFCLYLLMKCMIGELSYQCYYLKVSPMLQKLFD